MEWCTFLKIENWLLQPMVMGEANPQRADHKRPDPESCEIVGRTTLGSSLEIFCKLKVILGALVLECLNPCFLNLLCADSHGS